VVFEGIEAVFFEGLKNRIDMRARQFQAIGNTRFIPAFLGHAHHGPARFIGIVKGGKRGQVQLELQGRLIGF
jgi:hypothetical protein